MDSNHRFRATRLRCVNTPKLMSAGIFAGVIATQEFALGLSQLGTDGSNPSPSSEESAANPESLDQAVLISGVPK
jgi:hypothetical protein